MKAYYEVLLALFVCETARFNSRSFTVTLLSPISATNEPLLDIEVFKIGKIHISTES